MATPSVASDRTFTPPAGTRIARVSVVADSREAFDRVVAERDAQVVGRRFSPQTGEPRPPLAYYADAEQGDVFVFVEFSESRRAGAGVDDADGRDA